MSILAIDHAQLAMPEGQEALARSFYVEVLGLLEVPKPSPLAARGGCWFESGDVKLHLGVERDFRPARKAHVALLVEDLDALTERARRAGCEVEETSGLGAQRQVYIYDFFGNRLEMLADRG